MSRAAFSRWPRPIIIALVLGCAATILVGWGFALWGSTTGHQLSWRGRWYHQCYLGRGIEVYWISKTTEPVQQFGEQVIDAAGFPHLTVFLVPENQPPPLQDRTWTPAWMWIPGRKDQKPSQYQVCAYGWPRLAITASSIWQEEGSQAPNVCVGTIGGFDANAVHHRDWWLRPLLAYRPLMPGFALDSALFASAWWIVLFVPGIARSIIRRQRGRCPECGYDLRGSDSAQCSECGRLRKRNTSSTGARTASGA